MGTMAHRFGGEGGGGQRAASAHRDGERGVGGGERRWSGDGGGDLGFVLEDEGEDEEGEGEMSITSMLRQVS